MKYKCTSKNKRRRLTPFNKMTVQSVKKPAISYGPIKEWANTIASFGSLLVATLALIFSLNISDIQSYFQSEIVRRNSDLNERDRAIEQKELLLRKYINQMETSEDKIAVMQTDIIDRRFQIAKAEQELSLKEDKIKSYDEKLKHLDELNVKSEALNLDLRKARLKIEKDEAYLNVGLSYLSIQRDVANGEMQGVTKVDVFGLFQKNLRKFIKQAEGKRNLEIYYYVEKRASSECVVKPVVVDYGYKNKEEYINLSLADKIGRDYEFERRKMENISNVILEIANCTNGIISDYEYDN